MDETNLALICSDEDNAEHILNKFSEIPFKNNLIFYSSVKDFTAGGAEIEWSGIVVDFKTMIRSKEKSKLFELMENYPLLRLKMNEKGQFSGVTGGINYEEPELFKQYFDTTIKNHSPRRLRQFQRREVYLNVEVLNKDGATFKTNSTNVSLGGVFVLMSKELPKIGEFMDIIIHDIEDKSKISGEVKWVLEWGKSKSTPAGVGINYSKITIEQRASLKNILSKAGPV